MSDVKIRKFLRRQLAGTVYGSPRLIHDNILQGLSLRILPLKLFDELHNNLLGLTARRTVSKADERHVVLLNQFPDYSLRFCHFILRSSRINNRCIQNLSGRIHHRNLAACTERWIPSKDRLPVDRRLHQKLLQILPEYLNGTVLRFLRQPSPDFTKNRRSNQSLISVFCSQLQNIRRVPVLSGKPPADVFEDLLLRSIQLHRKIVFLLAAVNGKNTVPRELRNLFFKFEIHLVDTAPVLLRSVCRRAAFCILLLRCRKRSVSPGLLTNPGPKVRIVRNPFRNDVLCTLQRSLRRIHLLLFRNLRILHNFGLCHVFDCFGQQFFVCLTGQNPVRKGLQSLFSGNPGTRFPLLLVGTVQILHGDLCHGSFNLLTKLLCKLPLLLDG